MGNTKIDALSNLLKFKRKCRFLKWEHDILKKHKIPLYKFRFDLITSMKITENVLNYLKFKMKGINNAEQAEQNVDKELAAIKFVRYLRYDFNKFTYLIIINRYCTLCMWVLSIINVI